MSDCPQESISNMSIADAMLGMGPRTVEGDQGRVSMHGVHDIIAAIEYGRKRDKMRNKSEVANVLRTISNHRLATHDGRAS